MTVTDQFDRPLRDLRISITDRCNFRCVYCMPKEVYGADHAFLPRSEILSYEEITRLARSFVGLGVRKIRLTGGEPLVRKDAEKLVAELRHIPGIDLTMTTNGVLLPAKAAALRQAGLDRLTISLDSLDDAVFRVMNDANVPVASVLAGITAAEQAGFSPLKINMVVKRGINESSILPMARHFRAAGHILRFIEFMDVGHSNGWRLDDVVPAREILDIIHRQMPLEPADPNYRGEVANRWRYVDGQREVGIIASVTQPFCRDCTRARLSAEGKLYTCLFATEGTDLRALLRSDRSDEDISSAIRQIWAVRRDRYSEERSQATVDLPKLERSYIGG
jgi:GTP 3',8-cyclase